MSDFGTFFLPGPTEVRRDVLEAMLAPMLPHRGAIFEALFARIQDGLRPVFRTTRPVYVSSSSATGLMEAAIRCAAPGPILCMVNGAFSERFANIALACGRETRVVGGDWHQAVPLDVVESALRERRYAAITVVHSETSTGTLTSLPELAALAHQYDTAVLVDSVTGVGGVPVETDAWDLDFVLTGSQKALALPPGLAFGVASQRYIDQASQATARGLYFDMVEFEEFVHKNQTPSTPAISLLYATAVQGEHIARETIEARWARHTTMAEMTHAWVRSLREETGEPFCVYAPDHARSGTVTAIALPATLKGDDIVKGVARRGFVIGGGYGKLKSSTFRIGHMGDHTPDRLALCLDATADTIRELLAK
ncbi:pyridoxal-phosphate-dependent aminotransferase family protein [Gemmatimonas groenlandica]|uniref:Alanine--glyoxylate aminotransferase family protein n=1 Tax=Gemmatimonas groenlandica TaxID=2732249 RepID=A0A6M4IPI3_9BACT|nr:alanine--glyoxylate aminotransferase family protein [Gemmatimonas groenlandica]QJR36640.1 alanine--glyoxylate aminotransferase family protein [Gemmatimonas groenlandica]